MGGLVISNKILEKYFRYLKSLDTKSKKNLILKLTKSIGNEPKKEFDLKSIYGAWEDGRTSDEIISEITNSRVNKMSTESFE